MLLKFGVSNPLPKLDASNDDEPKDEVLKDNGEVKLLLPMPSNAPLGVVNVGVAKLPNELFDPIALAASLAKLDPLNVVPEPMLGFLSRVTPEPKPPAKVSSEWLAP